MAIKAPYHTPQQDTRHLTSNAACESVPHLQCPVGLVEHNVIWPAGQVLHRVDPLHGAKAAHKVDVHDAVHAEVDKVATDPALLALT